MKYYLRILEDGTIIQNNDEPDTDDRTSIGDGMLELIRCENGVFERMDVDGDWTIIPSTG